MAEEQQSGAAQNTLGQLFVQLGFKGLPNMLKGLNGLSAQFLLTKNAALQAIKPILSMSQNAVNSVTGWEKLHAVTGIAVKDIQDLSRFAKLNNIEFSSFFGQIQNVQQKLVQMRLTGKTEGLEGFTLLGLNPRNFDYKKPMEMLEAIKKRVQQVDEATGAGALRLLGLNEQLLYVWKQQNTNYNKRLNLNNEEINNLKEQQSAWNSLKVTWEAAQQKFISNQTWINKVLNETGNIITDLINSLYDWEYGGEKSGFYKFLAKIGQGIADIKVNILRKDVIDVPGQLIQAYNKGDKDVFKRYEAALRTQGKQLEADKIKYLEQINKNTEKTNEELEKANNKDKGNLNNFPLITDLISSQILNGKNLPSLKDIDNNSTSLTNITGAKPLNDEAKATGLPPLPQVAPSKPLEYLPSNVSKNVQYTVIQDIKQYIQGSEAQQIADDVTSNLKNAEYTSLYNKNLPNT